MSDLVDAIGKLGTLAVALAVFWSNRSQTRWTNAVGRRAAEVEDQKFRLALLDRRLVAIEAVRDAAEDFSRTGGVTREIVTKVYDALKIAQVVYPPAVEETIAATMRKLLEWQMYDRQRSRWRDHDNDRLNDAVEKMMLTEEHILKALGDLDVVLRRETRIDAVPAMVPASGWLRRFGKALPLRS